MYSFRLSVRRSCKRGTRGHKKPCKSANRSSAPVQRCKSVIREYGVSSIGRLSLGVCWHGELLRSKGRGMQRFGWRVAAPGGGWRDVKCKGAKVRDSAQWDNGEGELKGGGRGRPDSWLGTYDRSINPGLRFPFERVSFLVNPHTPYLRDIPWSRHSGN